MNITTTYSNIEKVKYTFTENDILEALITIHKIKIYEKNVSKYEFEIDDGCDLDEYGNFASEPASAKLTVYFEKLIEE